jgi:hypothetical protein
VCVVNAFIKGEIESLCGSGPVVGHFLVWWVIDNSDENGRKRTKNPLIVSRPIFFHW